MADISLQDSRIVRNCRLGAASLLPNRRNGLGLAVAFAFVLGLVPAFVPGVVLAFAFVLAES